MSSVIGCPYCLSKTAGGKLSAAQHQAFNCSNWSLVNLGRSHPDQLAPWFGIMHALYGHWMQDCTYHDELRSLYFLRLAIMKARHYANIVSYDIMLYSAEKVIVHPDSKERVDSIKVPYDNFKYNGEAKPDGLKLQPGHMAIVVHDRNRGSVSVLMLRPDFTTLIRAPYVEKDKNRNVVKGESIPLSDMGPQAVEGHAKLVDMIAGEYAKENLEFFSNVEAFEEKYGQRSAKKSSSVPRGPAVSVVLPPPPPMVEYDEVLFDQSINVQIEQLTSAFMTFYIAAMKARPDAEWKKSTHVANLTRNTMKELFGSVFPKPKDESDSATADETSSQ